jgi:predicted metal-binding membrane protein
MRMPGQSWLEAEASFLLMWGAMMAVMMLPALLPILRRCRPVRGAQLAAGYFAVWALFGAAIFPVGTVLAGLHWPAAAPGLVVLAGGALQFTGWKARRLAYCRDVPAGGNAWRQGLLLGLQCGLGCAGFTAILLAVGVMNPWVMTAVTAAITGERLFPAAARVTGVVVLAAGVAMTFA